ncbi:MAG TPA: hypothetical protein PKM50_04540 [Methanoregula sp.]|nr:hypothetical protein [Methanoregula sp.]
MEMKDPLSVFGTITSLHRMLRTEITEEKERQRRLYAAGTTGRLTLVILGAAIVANIIFFFVNPLYPLLFISASFFLFMFYFITLLIPLSLNRSSMKENEISRYLSGLKDAGIIRSTKKFSRVFLNTFFINCRPLFYGFAVIFSLDILIVVFMYFSGSLTLSHARIILFQSVSIIVFYFLVWKLEPYSTEFFSDVSGMKEHLIRKKVPGPVVSFLFLLGAVLALICILVTIILLPGITVNNLLSVSAFNTLSHLFIAIGVVLVTMYFILRYLHGITSRDLLERFSTNKTRRLLRQIEIIDETGNITPGTPGNQDPATPDAIRETTELLLEAQIYQVERKTIFGTFPVYIVNPDFSCMLPDTTI